MPLKKTLKRWNKKNNFNEPVIPEPRPLLTDKYIFMTTETKATRPVQNWNKPAYKAFVLIGIYFMIVKDFGQGSSFLGNALIFDPFDQKITFTKRPFYQKLLLFVHFGIAMALFILMLVKK